MTKQEAFDAVWKWFVVDGGQKSENHDNTCLYRGPNGTRCAVGVVIPDELYSEKMEGLPVGMLINDGRFEGLDEFLALNKELLGIMQNLHDGSRLSDNLWTYYVSSRTVISIKPAVSFTDYMRQGLVTIASIHDLVIPNAESATEPA